MEVYPCKWEHVSKLGPKGAGCVSATCSHLSPAFTPITLVPPGIGVYCLSPVCSGSSQRLSRSEGLKSPVLPCCFWLCFGRKQLDCDWNPTTLIFWSWYSFPASRVSQSSCYLYALFWEDERPQSCPYFKALHETNSIHFKCRIMFWVWYLAA